MNEEINNSNYTVSTATHIFLSIAAICFFLVLVYKPATTTINFKYPFALILCTTIFYCIVIPGVIIGTGSIYNSLTSEDVFILLKTISVAFGVFLIQMLVYSQYTFLKKYIGEKIVTIGIIGILLVNIAEAVYESWEFQFKPEIDGIKEFEYADIINFVCGILLLLLLGINLIKNFWKNNGFMTQTIKDNTMLLVSNLDMLFIIGYTLWNISFRISILENTSVFLFFILTLLLPVIMHIFNLGDWLQVRAWSLLFYIILALGLFPNEGTILPFYNKQGINNDTNYIIDYSNPLTQAITDKKLKMTLALSALIFSSLGTVNALIK